MMNKNSHDYDSDDSCISSDEFDEYASSNGSYEDDDGEYDDINTLELAKFLVPIMIPLISRALGRLGIFT